MVLALLTGCELDWDEKNQKRDPSDEGGDGGGDKPKPGGDDDAKDGGGDDDPRDGGIGGEDAGTDGDACAGGSCDDPCASQTCVDGAVPGGDCADPNRNDCSVHANCIDESNGHRCECVAGFLGDGKTCRGEAVRIVAHGTRTCAILSDGSLWCWGAALGMDSREHPDFNAPFSSKPVRMGADSDWIDVSFSDQLMCGIRGEGKLLCWGPSILDLSGSARDVEHPLELAESHRFASVLVRGADMCALRLAKDAVLCTGDLGVNKLVEYPGASTLVSTWSTSAKPGPAIFETPQENGEIAKRVCSEWRDECGICDGKVACRSASDDPKQPVPLVGLSGDVGSLSAGPHIGCALADRSLSCWASYELSASAMGGWSSALDVRKAADGEWAEVTTGAHHVCARNPLGAVACMGANGAGQLGRLIEPKLVKVSDDRDWIAAAVGDGWTCGQRVDGSLRCWGRAPRVFGTDVDALGVWLMDEAFAYSTSSFDTALQTTDVRKVRAGLGGSFGFSMCGLGGDGKARCFRPTGGAARGWTGATAAEVDANSDWSDISVGRSGLRYQLTGIRAGRLWSTGSPDAAPTAASDMAGWTMIRTSGFHHCGLRAGELHCGGFNRAGEVGHPSTGVERPLGRIGVFSDWTSVSVSTTRSAINSGAGNSCAIRQGELHCWGDNRFGQLGRGDYNQQNVPARVGDATDWKSIELASGPGTFACGIRGAGELYCWGDNRSGALGTGDYESRSVPTRVGDASDWSVVAVQGGVVVTGGHACGIRNGELYCWGDNTFGQLGTAPDRSLQMVEWE